MPEAGFCSCGRPATDQCDRCCALRDGDLHEWQAVWINDQGLRTELTCVDEDEARSVAEVRLTHPRYPASKAWVESRVVVKTQPWEVVE